MIDNYFLNNSLKAFLNKFQEKYQH